MADIVGTIARDLRLMMSSSHPGSNVRETG